MTTQPDKVVFDCMIFTQALINPAGPAGACVELARARRVLLVVSDYILQEVRELPAKLPPRLQLTAERVENLIQEVLECAEPWTDVPDLYLNPFDADDSPYVNLALAAGAKLITSRDRHLLDLMDQSLPEAREFCRRFPDLEVLLPEQLLQRIRQADDRQ